eukprot:scaffold6786_cov112-Isochrysis_galbana.AAC.3
MPPPPRPVPPLREAPLQSGASAHALPQSTPLHPHTTAAQACTQGLLPPCPGRRFLGARAQRLEQRRPGLQPEAL